MSDVEGQQVSGSGRARRSVRFLLPVSRSASGHLEEEGDGRSPGHHWIVGVSEQGGARRLSLSPLSLPEDPELVPLPLATIHAQSAATGSRTGTPLQIAVDASEGSVSAGSPFTAPSLPNDVRKSRVVWRDPSHLGRCSWSVEDVVTLAHADEGACNPIAAISIEPPPQWHALASEDSALRRASSPNAAAPKRGIDASSGEDLSVLDALTHRALQKADGRLHSDFRALRKSSRSGSPHSTEAYGSAAPGSIPVGPDGADKWRPSKDYVDLPRVFRGAEVNRRAPSPLCKPVSLPLTYDQLHLARRLEFLRSYYLLSHVAYIMSLALVGSLVFYSVEEELPFIDAFFIAMSSVCNCGLQTVNVSSWSAFSNAFRHVIMIGGGIVFTSSHQPLLRLYMLKKTWRVFERRVFDTPVERALRASKRIYAERLWYTSIICAVTPLVYFCVVNGTIFAVLACLNSSGLQPRDVFYIAISSFHSSIFLSMEQYVTDPTIVLFVTIGCACGFTFYPVLLRPFFYLEWAVLRLFARCYVKRVGWRMRRDSIFEVIDQSSPLLANAPVNHAANLFRDGDMDDAHGAYLNSWDQAFHDILVSRTPGTFHAFLFTRSETFYLMFAWIALTVAQAAPFWFEQWTGDGVIAHLQPGYRFFISLCQAAVVRFAAAAFVPTLQYSNAHIAITILAMFIPALPISTDRTYRKWKQVFRTSMVRLLTSRLFWLFAAMLSVIVAEEHLIACLTVGTRFDLMTRTLFETISAFSGCGFSLSLPGMQVSFSGSLSSFSKLIFAMVMLGGRHRTVDLGIDLGFTALEEHTEEPVGAATPLPRRHSTIRESAGTENAYDFLRNLKS